MFLKDFLIQASFQTTFIGHLKSRNIPTLLEFVYYNPIQCKQSIDDPKSGIRKLLFLVIKENPFLNRMLSSNPDEFVSNLPHILHAIKKAGAITCFVFNENSGVHGVVDWFSVELGTVQGKTTANVTLNSETPTPVLIDSVQKQYADKVDCVSIITTDPNLEHIHTVTGKPLTIITPFSVLMNITKNDIKVIETCFNSNQGKYCESKHLVHSALLLHNSSLVEIEKLQKLIPDSADYNNFLEKHLIGKEVLDIRMNNLKHTLADDMNKIKL